MTNDLVARLRRDEAQLREYLHLARKFGGDECGIRVKSPDHLLLDLGEAISRIESAEARLSTIEAETVERAAKVATSEVGRYQKLLREGKGEHGKAGYIRDDVWTSWNARESQSRRIAAAIRKLTRAS